MALDNLLLLLTKAHGKSVQWALETLNKMYQRDHFLWQEELSILSLALKISKRYAIFNLYKLIRLMIREAKGVLSPVSNPTPLY